MILAAEGADDAVTWGDALVPMSITLVVLVSVGFFTIAIAKRLADGRIRKNWLMGIRTRTTLTSDATWAAAQQAGERDLTRSGWASLITGPAALLIGLAVGAGDAERALLGWGIALGVGMVALVFFALKAVLVGHRAAKAVIVAQ